MNSIRVTVIAVYADDSSTTVEIPAGSTVGDLAAKVGAPSGCNYMIARERVNAQHVLSNGDRVIINKVKFEAGC